MLSSDCFDLCYRGYVGGKLVVQGVFTLVMVVEKKED